MGRKGMASPRGESASRCRHRIPVTRLAWLALAASLLVPARGHGKVSLAVMDLKPNGVEEGVAETMTELLASHINDTGLFTVISREDIKSMLGFEEDKRLVGCESDMACMAEIGGALGVEFITSGSVGKLGQMHVLNLQLIDIKRAKVEARVKRLLPVKNESESLAGLKKAALALVRPLRKGRTGFLAIEANEEGASVYVDEHLLGVTPLKQKSLPGGYHELVLKKEGFVEWAGEVEIRPGALQRMDAVMIPSQEFIKSYERRAKTMRVLAWSCLGLSLASAAGSTYFFLAARDNADVSSDANTRLDLDPGDTNARERADKANSEGRTQYALYWTLMAASMVSVGSSAILFYLGDPPEKYEEFQQKAAVGLYPLPGGLGLSVWIE